MNSILADALEQKLTPGAVLLVGRDQRTLHRGSPNTSQETRPLLYLLYKRPWYHEPLNFGSASLFTAAGANCNSGAGLRFPKPRTPDGTAPVARSRDAPSGSLRSHRAIFAIFRASALATVSAADRAPTSPAIGVAFLLW